MVLDLHALVIPKRNWIFVIQLIFYLSCSSLFLIRSSIASLFLLFVLCKCHISSDNNLSYGSMVLWLYQHTIKRCTFWILDPPLIFRGCCVWRTHGFQSYGSENNGVASKSTSLLVKPSLVNINIGKEKEIIAKINLRLFFRNQMF